MTFWHCFPCCCLRILIFKIKFDSLILFHFKYLMLRLPFLMFCEKKYSVQSICNLSLPCLHFKNQIFTNLRNLFVNTFFALKANKLQFKTFRGIQIRAQIGAKNEKKTFSTAIIFCREEILTNIYFLLPKKTKTFLLVQQMIGL
jgi:hypothetical protein